MFNPFSAFDISSTWKLKKGSSLFFLFRKNICLKCIVRVNHDKFAKRIGLKKFDPVANTFSIKVVYLFEKLIWKSRCPQNTKSIQKASPGVSYKTNRNSSGPLVPSHLGLAYVLLIEKILFPNLSGKGFSGLCYSNIPQYFLDFAQNMQIPNGTGPGVRRSECPLSTCHIRRKCSIETCHKSVKDRGQ